MLKFSKREKKKEMNELEIAEKKSQSAHGEREKERKKK
jgi:hypothetical protein